METPPARHYAILFTDLVNSSVINHRLKDRAYRERVLLPHLDILEKAILAQGGRLAGPPAGDSVMAAFDDVPEALAAAEAMQRYLTGLTFKDRDGTIQPVQIRVGIHYSVEPLRWDEKHLLAGYDDCNFASRVQSSANAGQILLSQRARDRVTNPESDFHAWPNRRIKSFTETPAALYERLWDGATKGEPGSSFLPVWFRVRNQYIPRPELEQRILELFQERAPGGSLFRLVTLHGFGGAGKTRLAVQCCLDAVGLFDGRVFYAGLEAVPASDESDQETRQNALSAAIAAAFGLEGDSALPQNLPRSLPPPSCLLLVDNFETVDCDAAAELLFALLEARPELHLLITGRETVKDVDAEKVLLVGGLEPEQARELLLARIRLCEGRDNWTPSAADEAAIAELLRLTEQHPLSIELVAAHAGRDSLTEIAASLNKAALSGVTALPARSRRRDGQTRHKSLRYCLDWSWDRLPPDAQTALTCVGLFPDRFTRSDALACFPDLRRAHLDRLAEAALLTRSEDPATQESLYVLLRPTREYAEAKRAQRPDPDAPVLTFIARYRLLMEQHLQGVYDHDQPALRALDGCHANALAALKHAISLRRTDDASPLYITLTCYYGHRAHDVNKLLVEQAVLQFRKETLPEGHPEIAQSLNNIAALYDNQGRYQEAEPLYHQALGTFRQALGEQHPVVATSLNNLALLYRSQGRYAEAEPLHKQALEIRRAALAEGHPDIAQSLNHLAELYRSQGRYAEAEPLHKQALEICLAALAEGHPDIAQSLNNLAGLYKDQSRYPEAEPLYEQALEIRRVALPEAHPDIAQSLHNLAELYRIQGRYTEAEPFYKQALEIFRKVLGENHPHYAICLNNLALLYDSQGRYKEAELLYLQVVKIYKSSLPEQHPWIATSLNNLALLYRSRGRYAQAEPLHKQALEIRRAALPEGHPDIAQSLNNLALLYYSRGRYVKAEAFYREAVGIFTQRLGAEHPTTRTAVANHEACLRKISEP